MVTKMTTVENHQKLVRSRAGGSAEEYKRLEESQRGDPRAFNNLFSCDSLGQMLEL